MTVCLLITKMEGNKANSSWTLRNQVCNPQQWMGWHSLETVQYNATAAVQTKLGKNLDEDRKTVSRMSRKERQTKNTKGLVQFQVLGKL